MKLGSMAGPLGCSQNYICHIALSNCTDYFDLKMKHEEENRSSTSDKYKEFRYYLNAIESLNNIIDYFYFENESLISHSNINEFRTAVHNKYPVLKKSQISQMLTSTAFGSNVVEIKIQIYLGQKICKSLKSL